MKTLDHYVSNTNCHHHFDEDMDDLQTELVDGETTNSDKNLLDAFHVKEHNDHHKQRGMG